ncbi:MAG TPA: hypothetical protein PKA64_23025, partial [Myxococcota bacterium]|nr:hypothetical protein [Myxococcota bacterium]
EEAALSPAEVGHDAGRDHAVDVMARYIHEAGWSAEEAAAPEDRARVLGDLFAACADCHAETRKPR